MNDVVRVGHSSANVSSLLDRQGIEVEVFAAHLNGLAEMLLVVFAGVPVGPQEESQCNNEFHLTGCGFFLSVLHEKVRRETGVWGVLNRKVGALTGCPSTPDHSREDASPGADH